MLLKLFKMHSKIGSLLFLLVITTILIDLACVSDKLLEPELPKICATTTVSYNLQIKEIIDTYCAVVGCHRGGTTALGNYITYDKMKPFLTHNEFKRFVIDLRNDPNLGMPPDWESNPGPKDLTQEDFDLLSCWIASGYPEN